MVVVCGIIWSCKGVNKKNMAHVINDMGHILENLVWIYGVDIIGDVETILDGVTATTVP